MPKAKLFWTILLTRKISKQPGNHYYASLTINRSEYRTRREKEHQEIQCLAKACAERDKMLDSRWNDGSITFRASPNPANLTTVKRKYLRNCLFLQSYYKGKLIPIKINAERRGTIPLCRQTWKCHPCDSGFFVLKDSKEK